MNVLQRTLRQRVSRVFGRVQLRDRAQAIVLANEHGLVVPSSFP
ncbi:hypothetical protein [Glaciihabitans sp. UYNi722]